MWLVFSLLPLRIYSLFHKIMVIGTSLYYEKGNYYTSFYRTSLPKIKAIPLIDKLAEKQVWLHYNSTKATASKYIISLVPFQIKPLPVWPELCLCYWSQFEGPEPFLSIQPPVYPYPSTAPAGSQSGEKRTKIEDKKKRYVNNKTVTVIVINCIMGK